MLLLPLYVATAVAVVFYAALPCAGALARKLSWSRFRARLGEVAEAPLLGYGDIAAARARGGEEPFGPFQFRGSMDALEGEDCLWLRSGEMTVVVDFRDTPFHALAQDDPQLPLDSLRRAGGLERLSWRKVRSFSSGTKVLVAGMLRMRGGQAVFAAGNRAPLVVVSYDGAEDNLVSRIVAAARGRNDLWNGFTFASCAAGVTLLGLLLAMSQPMSFLPSVLFVSGLVALAPLVPFLPPGMLFVFLGNAVWRRRIGIMMRRDLAKAGGRQDDAPAAPHVLALVSGFCLGLAVAVNGVLAFLAYRYLGG
jgi:hypothetical protein